MTAYYRSIPVRPSRARPSTVIQRPTASARVIGPARARIYDGRLDTGADETILPWSGLESLGVALIPGISDEIGGIGGSIQVMYGFVDFELEVMGGPVRWSHLAAFGPIESPLFGLTGFLEYFAVRLDGVKREIKLSYKGKAPPPRFGPAGPRRGR